MRFRPEGLALFLGGHIAYLTPWMWLYLIFVLVRRRSILTNPATAPLPERFLLAHALPPLALFLLVALVKPILPHWSLVGFLPLYPLLGHDWAQRRVAALRLRVAVLLAVVAVPAGLFLAQARWGLIPTSSPRVLQADPDARSGRLGPGRRRPPPARPGRPSPHLPFHQLLVPQRPPGLRAGEDPPSGPLLQCLQRPRFRSLEPPRGLART